MIRFESQKPFGNAYLNLNALVLKHMIVSSGVTANNYMNVYAGFRHHYFTLCAGYEFGVDRTINTAGTYELTASFNLRNKENRKLVSDFERW